MMRGIVRWILLLWAASYIIIYVAGFATALLLGPIRWRWLDLYEKRIEAAKKS